jgi:hypothetical protein
LAAEFTTITTIPQPVLGEYKVGIVPDDERCGFTGVVCLEHVEAVLAENYRQRVTNDVVWLGKPRRLEVVLDWFDELKPLRRKAGSGGLP